MMITTTASMDLKTELVNTRHANHTSSLPISTPPQDRSRDDPPSPPPQPPPSPAHWNRIFSVGLHHYRRMTQLTLRQDRLPCSTCHLNSGVGEYGTPHVKSLLTLLEQHLSLRCSPKRALPVCSTVALAFFLSNLSLFRPCMQMGLPSAPPCQREGLWTVPRQSSVRHTFLLMYVSWSIAMNAFGVRSKVAVGLGMAHASVASFSRLPVMVF
jgi:hypothetical protein